jgi:hypothetical protein
MSLFDPEETMPGSGRLIPRLPKLLDRKISKTGQTRGADDDEIYQNRVNRNNTVLISFPYWGVCSTPPPGETSFQSGFIVLISPSDYFDNPANVQTMTANGLTLGTNTLVFYETRTAWNAHNPDSLGWIAAQKRTGSLEGQYVARVPATAATAEGAKIIRGFTTTSSKGAGIRVYEYASGETIAQCRLQLEALFWLCADSVVVAVNNGMSQEGALSRKESTLQKCTSQRLLDFGRLIESRIINEHHNTICPFCLEGLSSQGFFNRMEQAQGREVLDLTVTELNLFHIHELRIGSYNHRPYNIGWGHHHCNVVVRDSGIQNTLAWMRDVLQRNLGAGYSSLAGIG